MLQNIPKEKILEIVKLGPTYPAKIAKQLGGGGDTMLIGAILSTMISTGDIKVSTLKVGGSPLYYVPEQESKLEDFLNYMNEKDKRVFTLLKEEKVLQDSSQDPLTRVALRTIKDFAKSFEVDIKGQKILFWRFYTLSKEDAIVTAKKIFVEAKPVEVEKPEEEAEVIPEKPEKIEQRPEHKPEHKASLIIEPQPIEHASKHVDVKQAEKQADIVQQILEEPSNTENVSSEKEKVHEKHEHHEHAEKDHEKNEKSVHSVKEHESKDHDSKEHDSKEHEAKEHEKKDHAVKSSKSDKVPKEPKQPKIPKEPKPEYDFFELILAHVASKKLDVISKEKIKKTEYDLVLKNHDNNEYIYCKAKDKDIINEGDLAPALIFAQNKKMPCVFISTGTLSQRAESMIHKEFSGMTFEHIVINK